MMANGNSVLRDRLITVQHGHHRAEYTLPELLSLLSEIDELEYPYLRPHQQHPWHAFLVQLAALTVHHYGIRPASATSDKWAEALAALADPAGESAWQLTSPIDQPAFFQPPVPAGTFPEDPKVFSYPDELDVLVTAKNHDVKFPLLRSPRAEHWLFALVTVQTMSGYSGAGYYGIARMNGGYASRPGVGLAPGPHWGRRFRRDLAVWLDSRTWLLDTFHYQEKGGHRLLWLIPWAGNSSISIESCDPFFIEICRRIRLHRPDSARFEAHFAGSSCPLVAAQQLQGNTGDVWTPVDSEGQALRVGRNGFSYPLLTKLLLTGDFPQKPALQPRPEDGDSPVLLAEVLVRGQGQTQGYHERTLPIPTHVRNLLRQKTEIERLGEMARRRISLVSTVQKKVLHPALCALLQGGNETLDLRDRRTRPWLDQLDRSVDQCFFPELWQDCVVSDEVADVRWATRLRTLAETQFDHARNSIPIPAARRLKALASAELIFKRGRRKYLPTSENPEEEGRHT